MSALKFIQLVARKKAAQKGGEGITTIANKLVAEGKVGEIAETFRLSGLTPDKWDNFIKSESDVLKYLNIIESTQKQAVKEATKTSSKGILKTTKKKEGPFPGWTPEVVEGGTRGASAIRIKQGFSTQSKLNHWSQNQQWVKDFIGRKNAEFNSLNRADQKEVLEMFETLIKKHKPKEPLAGGGVAGMLGEPTFQDEDHRVPFKTGNGVYDEDTEKELFSKRVRQLMDEGFDFGEAVREAMKEGYAEGGLAGMLGE